MSSKTYSFAEFKFDGMVVNLGPTSESLDESILVNGARVFDPHEPPRRRTIRGRY